MAKVIHGLSCTRWVICPRTRAAPPTASGCQSGRSFTVSPSRDPRSRSPRLIENATDTAWSESSPCGGHLPVARTGERPPCSSPLCGTVDFGRADVTTRTSNTETARQALPRPYRGQADSRVATRINAPSDASRGCFPTRGRALLWSGRVRTTAQGGRRTFSVSGRWESRSSEGRPLKGRGRRRRPVATEHVGPQRIQSDGLSACRGVFSSSTWWPEGHIHADAHTAVPAYGHGV